MWLKDLMCRKIIYAGIHLLVTLFHLEKSFVTSLSTNDFRIGIIGGGASGMFSAATASAATSASDVLKDRILKDRIHNGEEDAIIHVLESSNKLMSKVEISGGGRCNVLHDTSKPISDILNGYPRGKRELNGLFSKHFSPTDAERWFRNRGVELKTESDGRMFPITDSSHTIMDAIMDSVKETNHVHIGMKRKVAGIRRNDNDDDDETNSKNMPMFTVTFSDETEEDYNCIILATGSNPSGHELAAMLGHTIVPPVPSLFTFNTKNQNKEEGQIFYNLSGLSVKNALVTLKMKAEGADIGNSNVSSVGKKKKRKKNKIVSQQEGPLLITHHGISGPAVLRLSAFAAREFRDLNYRTNVQVHWAPAFGSAQEIESQLWKMTSMAPKRTISTSCPLLDPSDGSSVIPRRLWSALVTESGLEKDKIWAEAPKKKVATLSRNIAEFEVDVTGKGVFKEEFVTAGGVQLKEITMKTMESKICPGLYFCGEVIDVDGVTGGFNFMNCWSTGHTAGMNAVSRLENLIRPT